MTAPELLAQEMPLVRRINDDLKTHGYIEGTAEHAKMFVDMIKFHRWFGWRIQTQGESK